MKIYSGQQCAQAGIQERHLETNAVWIPAFAGMTKSWVCVRIGGRFQTRLIPFRVQNDKKVVILREAKRSRRIHATHLHPPPHGFRDFARNDGEYFCCLEMEIELPADTGNYLPQHSVTLAPAVALMIPRAPAWFTTKSPHLSLALPPPELR